MELLKFQMAQEEDRRAEEWREGIERQRILDAQNLFRRANEERFHEQRRLEERARAERDERRHEQLMQIFMLAFGRKPS